MNLISNEFINNKASNGGALYLEDGNDINENNTDIINIENNTFQKNSAENFGGAIYSEYSHLYLATSKNNEITFNNAGVMGGGIYTPKNAKKTIFNIDDLKIENNTVNSYINDYTSKPSYITLNTVLPNENINIVTGDPFPLDFTLYDEYDNVIEDITKYYSSMIIKVILEEINTPYQNGENINNKKKNSNFKLIGNIGTFIKGNNNIKLFDELYNKINYDA